MEHVNTKQEGRTLEGTSKQRKNIIDKERRSIWKAMLLSLLTSGFQLFGRATHILSIQYSATLIIGYQKVREKTNGKPSCMTKMKEFFMHAVGKKVQ